MKLFNRLTSLVVATALMLAVTSAVVAANSHSHARIMGGRITVKNIHTMKKDGLMHVSMDLVLDSLHVAPDKRVVLVPKLRARSGNVSLNPIVINGRRQQIMYDRRDHRSYTSSKPVVARRDNGTPQTISYSSIANYDDWMNSAMLEFQEDMCGCGDLENADTEAVARVGMRQCRYLAPKATGLKTWQLHGRAYIDFPVDRTELHPDYRNNPRELQKIVDTISIVRRDTLMTVTGIDIHGYASPESPYQHNAWLASERAKTLKNYVRQLVHIDDTLFTVHSTAEDWDGLRRYIRESNLDHRDSILAIACNESIDPDRREQLIKTLYPDQYSVMLATWYPALRHSDYTITCRVRPFTLDEAKRLIKTRPQLLSLGEMYRVAQSLEPGSEGFNEVMLTAVRIYPDDPVANLNVAVSLLNSGNIEAAKPYLDKAGYSKEAQEARQAYDENK